MSSSIAARLAGACTTNEAGIALLDSAHAKVMRGQLREGLAEMFIGLRELRDASPLEEWRQFSQYECLHHPMREVVHQDPLTWRAFEKPRGYPGDAGILDFIYRTISLPAGITPLGAQIYEFTFAARAAESVRARCRLLSRMIDEAADRSARPTILSVACGHLREAQRSRAVAEGRIGEIIALDHDRESLALVEREQRGQGVRPWNESVRGLIAGKVDLSDLDLAYAAGLFDYLVLPVAIQVTRTMLGMVKSGGKVLVANFAPDLSDIGYMEAFMAWNLIYRDEAGMAEIARGLPQDEVAESRIFRDEDGYIVYLEVTKK